VADHASAAQIVRKAVLKPAGQLACAAVGVQNVGVIEGNIVAHGIGAFPYR
jgi:hypothetical protein